MGRQKFVGSKNSPAGGCRYIVKWTGVRVAWRSSQEGGENLVKDESFSQDPPEGGEREKEGHQRDA